MDDPPPAPPRGQSGADARVATLYVCDLRGSTALAERLEAEAWRAVLGEYFGLMRGEIERAGGRVAKVIGDAVVAVFDSDEPAEAARRAAGVADRVRGALALLSDDVARRFGVGLQNRTGLATGALADADGVLAGDVLARAETLESGAPPMETLVDATTAALLAGVATLRALASVAPKRGGDPVDAWLLVEVDALDGASAADVAPEGSDREDRRTVTILFADLRWHGEGWDVDDGRAADVAGWFGSIALPLVERHGGTAERFVGDALMAIFGLPNRREDDAARALRAAHELRETISGAAAEPAERWGAQLELRIGVNTGAVIAGDASRGERMVTGDPVNVAARLAQSAAPGSVVCGELTARLAGDVAEVTPVSPLVLRGKAEPVAAFQLAGVRHVGAGGRRHQLPLIGRADELAALRGGVERVAAGRRAERMVLLGDAGVGKSRLVQELLDGLDPDARVLRGGCLSYGQGITFWPLLRVVHDAASIAERDDASAACAKVDALLPEAPDVSERLRSLAGLHDVPFAVGEQLWALRRLWESWAEAGPLVVVLDDIH